MLQYYRRLGLLRTLLIVLGIVSALGSFSAGGGEITKDWRIITTVYMPALAPVVLAVILFDLMMCRIRMSDATGSEFERFRWISRVYLVLVACILLSWTPFFVSIFARL